MKKVILSIILAFLLISGLCGAQTKGLKVVPIKDSSGEQVGLYGGSFALIIGVSDYRAGWPKLPSVVGETEQIQAALEAHGFDVRRVLDPDENTLKQEFERFIDRYGYERDNRLCVFFSGHGYSRKKGAKGYLVPVDAPDPSRDEKGFLRKALPMSQVLAWCRQMEAKHVLFLFDSCFSGTIFKTKALPEVPPHISRLTARPVRQFISAGDAGEQVPAKSVFATCFLRALRGDADVNRDGYVTGTELGMYLNENLLYYSTGQTPQYGKIRDPELDEGDFVFEVTKHLEALPLTKSTYLRVEFSQSGSLTKFVPDLSSPYCYRLSLARLPFIIRLHDPGADVPIRIAARLSRDVYDNPTKLLGVQTRWSPDKEDVSKHIGMGMAMARGVSDYLVVSDTGSNYLTADRRTSEGEGTARISVSVLHSPRRSNDWIDQRHVYLTFVVDRNDNGVVDSGEVECFDLELRGQ